MKYRIFYIDNPIDVDEYLLDKFNLKYDSRARHPRLIEPCLCITLDSEQGILLKLLFQDSIILYPIENEIQSICI